MKMTDRDEMLVSILATVDAISLPPRAEDHTPAAGSNIYAARRTYPSDGVPWTSGATTEADRKKGRRILEKLEADGMVSASSSRQAISVMLTAAGEAFARSLVGLPGIADAHTAASAVLHWCGDGWVSETILVANRPNASYGSLGPNEGWLLAANDEILLPALCRQYVRANSDLHGRVYHQVTETGLDWVLAGEPELPSDLPEADPAAMGLYLSVRDSRREELRTMTPVNRSALGRHPLPVGAPSIRAANGVDPAPPRRRRKKRAADG